MDALVSILSVLLYAAGSLILYLVLGTLVAVWALEGKGTLATAPPAEIAALTVEWPVALLRYLAFHVNRIVLRGLVWAWGLVRPRTGAPHG